MDFVHSDEVWRLLDRHFNLPPSLTDLTLNIGAGKIATCSCEFNLTHKRRRTLEQTISDINKGLAKCKNLITKIGE